MKTNQLMIRKMGDFEVIQRTGDKKFNATHLLKQWNEKSDNKKKISHYFENSSTEEFINAIMEEDNLSCRNSVIMKSKSNKGDNAGTWMCATLFIDYCMWLNPSFKVKVIKFVYDQMIEYRNNAGDAYVKLAASISKIVNKDFMPRAMSKIGEALNYITFNEHEKNLRNKFGEESKLRELYMLENKVSELVDEGFITTYDNLIKYLRNLYFKRYTPEIFTTN